MPIGVDEIQGWPVLVVESAPYPVATVDRDRVTDIHLLCRLANVADVLLDVEFRGVHADHHQSAILVPLRPRSNVRQRAPPIYAGIGPELDQYDFSAQTRRGQWWRIEPLDRAIDSGKITLDR